MRYRWIQRQMSLLLIRKTSAILSGCHLLLNSESSLKFDIQYTVISYLGSGVGFLNIQMQQDSSALLVFKSPGTGETETYRHISEQNKQLLPCPEATHVWFIFYFYYF